MANKYLTGKAGFFVLKSSLMLMAAITIITFFVAGATADDQNNSLAVIYASQYGSTAQNAKWVAEGIGGNAVAVNVREVKDIKLYRQVILGTAIYRNNIAADMSSFLQKNKGTLDKRKVVALFVVCGGQPSEQYYLNKFTAELGIKPALTAGFRGWLKKEILSPADYKTMEKRFQSLNMPFENYDFTDKNAAVEFGKKIAVSINSGK